MKKISLFDEQYLIIKDDNAIFDLELVKNIATDYFKPYDYIFGDFAYGKLRLKGFYKKNNKNVNKINNIDILDEYIKKYCAFQCKYFLIEKIQK